MPVCLNHDLEDLADRLLHNLGMEQVGHGVDENLVRLPDMQRVFQALWEDLHDAEWVSILCRHGSPVLWPGAMVLQVVSVPPVVERECITLLASGGHPGTAGGRIPGHICPANRRFSAHRCAPSRVRSYAAWISTQKRSGGCHSHTPSDPRTGRGVARR